MRKGTVAVILAAAVAAGCSSMVPRQGPNDEAHAISAAATGMARGADNGARMRWNRVYAPTPNPYVGELVFNQYCSGCHGNGDRLKKKSSDTVHDMASHYYVILYGDTKDGRNMPSFRTRLTKFQIFDILSFLGYDVESNLRGDYAGFRED